MLTLSLFLSPCPGMGGHRRPTVCRLERLAKVLPNTQNYGVDFGFMGWGVEYVDLIVLVRGCEGAERHTAPGMRVCSGRVARWPPR